MKKIVTLLSTILLVVAMLTAAPLNPDVHALTEEEAAWVNEARAALQEIVEEREIMATVYLSDTYLVRNTPTVDGEIVVGVPSGQTVFITDAVIDENYEAWSYVDFYYRGTQYNGYIQRANLACSDERFLAWEMDYGMNPGAAALYALDADATYADIEQFPESYRASLLALKEKHPNWIFVPLNTGLDWNTVIANEIIGGKSLVYKTFPDYCKEGLYDDGDWYYASKGILEFYMDPRNALKDDAIFQFEQLTYNESYHTEAAIKAFLENTFMNSSKNAPGTNMKFYFIFWAIGAEEGREVSPFHLAARVLQEQGQGKSPLISGTYPGYEGYYNYFNVKASGTTTEEIIKNGLQYAKEKNWKGAYYSIMGGADVISANYIKKGQDTLYLQKYNVAPYSQYPLYTHQYMQNISAPTTEAKNVKKLYAEANALDSSFVFKIPVYKNMPETACPMPTPPTNVDEEKVPDEHRHTFSTEWASDDTYHWHAATCEHTEETLEKAEHTSSDWIVDVAATTQAAGSRHKECTVCEKVLVTEEIPQLSGEVTSGIAGTVKSFSSDSTEDNTTTIQLMDVSGNVIAQTTVTANSDSYTLTDVSAGDYTVQVSEEDHVTREYSVTVGNEMVTLNVEVWLLGDVNGDGDVTVKDKKVIFNHMEGTSTLADYAFAVGDVDGNGDIVAKDKKMIYNHIEGNSLLW